MSIPSRPKGYRFRPTIQFLINLLHFKAAGGGDITGCTEYPEDLYEFDVYGPGKEPWNLFSGEHEILELQDVSKRWIKEKYVLTQLSKIGPKNFSRTAGAGTWDDDGIIKHAVLDGQEMGDWRSLNYVYWGDEAVDNRHHYKMHELQLSEYALGQLQAKYDDFVICRVTKDESKVCRIRRGKKRARQQDDCPAAKKMKKQNQEGASCSTVVPEEPEVDYYGQCIDFPELGQHEQQISEPWDYEQLQPNWVPSCSNFDFLAEEVSVEDMCGAGQNQQEQQISEPWDYEQSQLNWVPSCSNFDFLAEELSVEEMAELLYSSENCLGIY